MRPAITRPVILSTLALCSAGLTFTPQATAAKRSPVRVCDGTIQRVKLHGLDPAVLQGATKISSRGRGCDRTIRTINGMIQSVGTSPIAPPAVCCSSVFFADDADYWTRARWQIRHRSGDPRGNGERWWITKGKTSIRFTRWI